MDTSAENNIIGLIRRLICFIALIVALFLILPQRILSSETLKRPILVAHRGANMEADENTLKAYSIAIELGMDYIECDPRLTKDGVFVIMHDGNVDRMTNGKGKIADMTLSEIKALKTKNGESIPTLEEVLKLAKDKNTRVYLDTKDFSDSYMKQLMEFVKKCGMGDSVMAGLWTREQLKFMRKNYPEVAASIPYPTPMPSLKLAKKSGATWVGTILEKATDSMLKEADSLGLKVITLEINDRETIVREIKAGMQVIQTDDSKLLRTIINELFGNE
jgi:glycerophosphoryl diester phosphodiesterase